MHVKLTALLSASQILTGQWVGWAVFNRPQLTSPSHSLAGVQALLPKAHSGQGSVHPAPTLHVLIGCGHRGRGVGTAGRSSPHHRSPLASTVHMATADCKAGWKAGSLFGAITSLA